MPKRSLIKSHIESLAEIKEIINAMKNLSLMEINKTTKFFRTQAKVVNTIENVIKDFFSFYPKLATPLFTAKPLLYILIGSERGFCGNFNQIIVQLWEETLKSHDPNKKTKTFVIGNKLASKISSNYQAEILSGPNATEEIQTIILSLIEKLEKISKNSDGKINPANWVLIYNEETSKGIRPKVLQPFVTIEKKETPVFTTPPLLYLEPQQFVFELANNYLFAVMYQLFYKSFIIEHQERLKHMEAALDWLEKKNNQFRLQMNRLRQEEIIEEIEIITQNIDSIFKS